MSFGKSKATTKKATKKAETPKVTKVPVDKKKELKSRKEAQQIIGADTKTVSQELRELREQQKKLREKAKKLREEAKKRKEMTKDARSKLASGRKELKEKWASVRTDMTEFRKALRSEDGKELNELAASLVKHLADLSTEVHAVASARLTILGAETLEGEADPWPEEPGKEEETEGAETEEDDL